MMATLREGLLGAWCYFGYLTKYLTQSSPPSGVGTETGDGRAVSEMGTGRGAGLGRH